MEDKIKNWLNQNWLKSLIVVAIIFLVGGCFYWYAYRPSKIRHDCSWIKRHTNAVSAKKGASGETDITKCLEKYGYGLYGEFECGSEYQPAKDWWGKANQGEYDFCIHEKGL